MPETLYVNYDYGECSASDDPEYFADGDDLPAEIARVVERPLDDGLVGATVVEAVERREHSAAGGPIDGALHGDAIAR